jgi:hypothetical protein
VAGLPTFRKVYRICRPSLPSLILARIAFVLIGQPLGRIARRAEDLHKLLFFTTT